MYGVMGIANAQRSLNTIRSFTEFISQESYSEVVTMISLVNEVQAPILGADIIRSLCVVLSPHENARLIGICLLQLLPSVRADPLH